MIWMKKVFLFFYKYFHLIVDYTQFDINTGILLVTKHKA